MSKALDLSCYMDRTYEVVVTERVEDGDHYYHAEIPDLPGCAANADSWEELWERINESKQDWFEHALEHGLKIPEQKGEELTSGRLLLRLPRSLHKELRREAEKEGLSLNQLMVSILEQHRGKQVILEEVADRLIDKCCNKIKMEIERLLKRRLEPSSKGPIIPESPVPSRACEEALTNFRTKIRKATGKGSRPTQVHHYVRPRKLAKGKPNLR